MARAESGSSLQQADGDAPGFSLNRQKVDARPGAYVQSEGAVYQIMQVLDFDTAVGVAVETGRSSALRIAALKPVTTAPEDLQALAAKDIEEVGDADWKVAEQRYAAIRPLLGAIHLGREVIAERAAEVGVDPATLYRWLKRFQSLGVVAALVPKKRGWRPGQSRLTPHAEAIIKEVLDDTYLTKQRPSAQQTVVEVQRRCMAQGVQAPHPNTIRSRIACVSEHQRLTRRGFGERAKNKFSPAAGRFPNADYPLSVVQIDHTRVDIVLVDDMDRKPVGRPWITVAIDVYSRMVAGYYLSFDAPSETSVAMCVAHAILPKEDWLALHRVDARWDVWGLMRTIHTDNGPDFRSSNFREAATQHGINLEFRPVKQPRYGGHIERLQGTLLREIHALPGTTFSSIKTREGYDSDKHAALTISEFEEWLVTLICKVYHQRLHGGIGMSPARKWEIGIFGNAQQPGCGLLPRPADRLSLLLDFLPSFRRTIQTYGVAIDGMTYYSDVLRSWINAADPTSPNKKREFVFRRDPRDISAVWFYDPDLSQYFKIPFADQALPSMSVWEYREAKEMVRKEGAGSVNQHQVLQAITEMRSQVAAAQERTKKARRASQRRRTHERAVSPAAPLDAVAAQIRAKPAPSTIEATLDDDVAPFDDIA